MSDPPSENKSSNKKVFCGCLGCLTILVVSVLCVAGILIIDPPFLKSLGIFGQKARQVYQLAPDPVASDQLAQAFTDRQIPGVRVYVIPIKGKPTQGAFIILDASKGYKGLNLLDENDEVFIELLRDLTHRNREENLRIEHVTVEYRDEEGNTMLAFTVNQEAVESYADGLISQSEFVKAVHFDLKDTIRRLGIDEFLEGSQP
jgi:hypothetical protein